jgi:hypothetical protein
MMISRLHGVSFLIVLLVSRARAFAASAHATGLSKLSVTELKRLLAERGVDF